MLDGVVQGSRVCKGIENQLTYKTWGSTLQRSAGDRKEQSAYVAGCVSLSRCFAAELHHRFGKPCCENPLRLLLLAGDDPTEPSEIRAAAASRLLARKSVGPTTAKIIRCYRPEVEGAAVDGVTPWPRYNSLMGLGLKMAALY